MTELQYMALSQVAYDNLPTEQFIEGSSTRPWTVFDLIQKSKIDGASLDSLNNLKFTNPALSILSSMQDWTLLDHYPDDASGLSCSVFQAPYDTSPTSGQVVFAFRGTHGLMDWSENFKLVIDQLPQQFISTKNYVNNFLSNNASTVGYLGCMGRSHNLSIFQPKLMLRKYCIA